MTNEIDETLSDAWKQTRSGAWAGRGFLYQHLFSTLILVRQWSGLAPTGLLVPEGLDDCVVELPGRDVWIQTKSKQSGTFSRGEVKAIFEDVRKRAALVNTTSVTLLAAGLERPCSDLAERKMDELFNGDGERVVVCSAPGTEIVDLLCKQLNVAEVIAEGVANDLYRLVAESAAANASSAFEDRRRISTTEVECRILDRLEAEDPSAIDQALATGVLGPVDLVTQISEPSFYQGVKVKPGHVAAGLVLERPAETRNVINSVKNRRQLLITGPSGAGKSALLWLVANSMTAELRWYQVSAQAGAHDAEAIVRFVQSRRPTSTSSIGLVFDDVGRTNGNLWDILANELRALPDVYLLGSIRNEDRAIITNQADTEFFEVSLDERLAQSVWTTLTNNGQTGWSHWREPFEQSKGLMLEYVHLLTQGRRLAAVIDEQVRQREREGRRDELAIIRSTAILCAYGGEVDAERLFKLLALPSDRASQVLRRLIDEHLVRERLPGVLGGLHTLRSKALADASHDEIVHLRSDSLWRSLLASTEETLPRIIHAVLTETQGEAEAETLQKLSETLEASDDIDVWSAILTGLGLGTLERHVTTFVEILGKHGIQRAHWSAASVFVALNSDEFPKRLEILRNAIMAFRTLPKSDVRASCLHLLTPGAQVPACTSLRQANQLLFSLAPIAGGKPIRIAPLFDFAGHDEPNIHDVASLLATAYLLEPEVTDTLMEVLGGEQTLLALFRSQTPWITEPTIEPAGDHGRTVRANWFFLAEPYQADPQDAVDGICETLIAISPTSDAVASDAIDPSGNPVRLGDFSPWSENIPRGSLPAEARVAWNVAFQQLLLARAATDSLTNYTRQIAELVKRTERLFRSFTEKWIQRKRIPSTLDADIREIVSEVSTLAYATPSTHSSPLTTAAGNRSKDDTLGALLTDVLDNLVRMMSQDPAKPTVKATATYAGTLAGKAREHEQSKIWRTTSSPPLNELTALAERLYDVACILHEMSYDHTPGPIKKHVRAARKGGVGKAVGSAARHCRSLAEERLRRRLRSLEKALEKRGWATKCWLRPVDKADSPYWPAVEIALLVDIKDFETETGYINDCLSIGEEQLAQDWQFRVVPVIDRQVVTALALLPSSQGPLPDMDFAQEWRPHIDRPFLSTKNAEAFDAAVAACTHISGIVGCRGLTNLHKDEEVAFSKAVRAFKDNRDIVNRCAEKTDLDEFIWAMAFLNDSRNQVVREIQAKKAGQTINDPFWMRIAHGKVGGENDSAVEFAAGRMLLRQAECLMTTR